MTPTREQIEDRYFSVVPAKVKHKHSIDKGRVTEVHNCALSSAAFILGYETACSDLEAKIAEQAAELNRIVSGVKLSIPTNTMEQWAASEIRLATNKLRKELTAEQAKVKSMQAQIDSIMLEYCPNEMTSQQIQEWKESQIAAVKEKNNV